MPIFKNACVLKNGEIRESGRALFGEVGGSVESVPAVVHLPRDYIFRHACCTRMLMG